MPIHLIDICVLLLCIFFFIRGFQKGFLIEITIIAALILGILAAMELANVVIINLKSWFGSNPVLPYLGYLFTFLTVFFLVQLLGRSIEKVLKVVQLNIINRIIGGITSLIKIAFIISLIFWLTNQADWISNSLKKEMLSYQYLAPFAPFVIEKIGNFLPLVKDLIQEAEVFFEDINQTLTSGN